MKKKIIELMYTFIKKIMERFTLFLNKCDFLGYFDIIKNDSPQISKIYIYIDLFLIYFFLPFNVAELIKILEAQEKKPIFNKVQLIFLRIFLYIGVKRLYIYSSLFGSFGLIFIFGYCFFLTNFNILLLFGFPISIFLMFLLKKYVYCVRFIYFSTTLFFFYKLCKALHLFLVNNYAISRTPLAFHYNSPVSNKSFTLSLLDFNYTLSFEINGFSIYFLFLTTLIFFLVAFYELFNDFIPFNDTSLKKYYETKYNQDLLLLKQKTYLDNFNISLSIFNVNLPFLNLQDLLYQKYQIYFKTHRQYEKALYLYFWLRKPLTNDKINLFLFYLFLEWFICLAFLTKDLLFFYITFECSIIPMLLLIGLKGSRIRKVRANYLFFLYTFIGSLFMLSALIIIFQQTHTFNIDILKNLDQTGLFSNLMLKYLWFAIFLTFAFKIPLIPFHLWLPEAHVEASTSGSVILAALLLKLGFYGILCFLIPIFPKITLFFIPMVQCIAILSIVYSALIAIRQVDMKRIIAYSSINHMAFSLMGLFSFTATGIKGSFILMISHGFVSAALFFCIGFLYKRTHTRIITQYSGLTLIMPHFIILFGFFLFSNIGFPGTLSFIAELSLILGICNHDLILGIICIILLFFSTIFSILLFNKIAFNYFKLKLTSFSTTFLIQNFSTMLKDLSRIELLILIILAYYTIRYGIKPDSLFTLLTPDITKLLLTIKLGSIL